MKSESVRMLFVFTFPPVFFNVRFVFTCHLF